MAKYQPKPEELAVVDADYGASESSAALAEAFNQRQKGHTDHRFDHPDNSIAWDCW